MNQVTCAVKAAFGFNYLNNLQMRVYKHLESNPTGSILLRANPGAGKTLAYLLPLMTKLHSEERSPGYKRGNDPRALVIVPTAEMALQTSKIAKALSHHIRVRVNQFNPLAPLEPNRDLLILSLKSWLKSGIVTPNLVLDEADLLFKDKTIKNIVTNNSFENLIISAVDIAKLEMIEIKDDCAAKEPPRYKATIDNIPNSLRNHPTEKTLLICGSVGLATRLHSDLESSLPVSLVPALLHQYISDYQRLVVWNHFRSNRIQSLICTDSIARDLDTSSFVKHVIFCDQPANSVDDRHRIARTTHRVSYI